jgi:hypothetical protein
MFKTFKIIQENKDTLDKTYSFIKNSGINCNFDFNILPKNIDTVRKIAPILLQTIKKEQELIKETNDYYIARDIQTNTYYICYKNLLMIDIDNKTTEFTESEIINHFSKLNFSWMIYKSTGGYHIFCTSQTFEYRNLETINFMIKNHCDFYYSIFSYIRGFCTRLNKKSDFFQEGMEFSTEQLNTPLYTLIKVINPENSNKDLIELVLKQTTDKYINETIY